MDNLEKVEKLRERANVSYEEARTALEENGWDMLEAMVSLERKGRVNGPSQSQYSTSYEQQSDYTPVKKTVYNQSKKGGSLRNGLRRFFQICRDNSLCINREENLVFKMPVIVFVVILFCFWKIAIPLMIVGLFFNFRYSFEGADKLTEANDLMKTAGKAAERVKTEFAKTVNGSEEEQTSQEAQQTVRQEAQQAAQQTVQHENAGNASSDEIVE